MAKSDKRFLNGGWIAGSIAGQAIAALVVLNGLAQTFERQISQCIRLNVLPDFLHAVRRGDELLAGGRINPVKAGETVGGQLMRIWTSLAPASLTIRTILRLVVPRMRESSTRTTRFPAKRLRTGFSFSFTPRSRLACVGSINVRPT